MASSYRGPTDFLDLLTGTVNVDINRDLTKLYTHEDVHEALQQMHFTKALSPNGMSLFFYQKYWHVIGSSISIAVLHALNTGSFSSYLNYSYCIDPQEEKPRKSERLSTNQLIQCPMQTDLKGHCKQIKRWMHLLISPLKVHLYLDGLLPTMF